MDADPGSEIDDLTIVDLGDLALVAWQIISSLSGPELVGARQLF